MGHLFGNRALGVGSRSGAIGEENIQTAVIVIVEKGDARAHGFEKIFPGGGRGFLLEVNADSCGDINESPVESRIRLGFGSLSYKKQQHQRATNCADNFLLRLSHTVGYCIRLKRCSRKNRTYSADRLQSIPQKLVARGSAYGC